MIEASSKTLPCLPLSAHCCLPAIIIIIIIFFHICYYQYYYYYYSYSFYYFYYYLLLLLLLLLFVFHIRCYIVHHSCSKVGADDDHLRSPLDLVLDAMKKVLCLMASAYALCGCRLSTPCINTYTDTMYQYLCRYHVSIPMRIPCINTYADSVY